MSRRELLNSLTKLQLIKLGKKYGVVLPTNMTKIGMGSYLMSAMTAKQIEKEVGLIKK